MNRIFMKVAKFQITELKKKIYIVDMKKYLYTPGFLRNSMYCFFSFKIVVLSQRCLTCLLVGAGFLVCLWGPGT